MSSVCSIGVFSCTVLCCAVLGLPDDAPAFQCSELIRPIQSPPRLDHRYLHEDVGWGLVPWMHLAAAAGSPAPTITALTHLAGMINGIDYPREGLTLQRMGLAGKTPGEIRTHVGAPATRSRSPSPGLPTPRRKPPIRTSDGELNAARALTQKDAGCRQRRN